MKRRKITQFLCAAIAAGVIASVTPATTARAVENNNVKTSVQEVSEETRSELNYAIEEIRIAVDLLDNADLTNIDNTNRMTIFATNALDRVRGLGIDENSDLYVHVESIEKAGEEMREASYRFNRVIQAIRNVETVFSRDNETTENMHNVINTLNKVLTQELEAGILNQTTLRSAVNTMHQYASQIPQTTPENVKEEVSQETITELNYAIEEIRIAVDLLDNADLTNIDNTNRMTIFATSALDRVRGLGIDENSDLYVHVESIEKAGEEMREASYRFNRVIQAIRNVETVFSRDNETTENMHNVINTLNKVLTQELEAGILNQKTLRSAVNTMHQYASQVPAPIK